MLDIVQTSVLTFFFNYY